MQLTHDNYHSPEADRAYMSNSQLGGWIKCEARQAALLSGDWTDDSDPTHFQLGRLVDELLLTPGAVNLDDEQYSWRGKHRAWVTTALSMVDRARRDPAFMDAISGEHQVVITFAFAGCNWKAKLDCANPAASRLVDLKTVGHSLSRDQWDEELSMRVPFYHQFDYWRQLAVYRRAYHYAYGDYPETVLIAAITTETPPDLELYEFRGDHNWKAEEERIWRKVERIGRIKSGEVAPIRCGACDYCRATKRIVRPVVAEYFRTARIDAGELLSGIK